MPSEPVIAAPATAPPAAVPPATAAAAALASAPAPEPQRDPEPALEVAAAGSPLDLDVLRDLWPAVLESIREATPMLGAVLADALPVEIRGDDLVVGFDPANDFFRRKAEDRPNRDALIEAIRAMTGMRARPVFELRDLSELAPERAEAARPLTETEVLDRLKSTFDAEEIAAEADVVPVPDGDPGPEDPGPENSAPPPSPTPTAEEHA